MNDEYFMRKAIKLALRAKGKTFPNPLVGAVIVKNNKIISSAYHHRSGLAHAEVIALDKAKGKARGTKLYLNLEPCCHFGKTPPCVYAILESEIREVVLGAIDPNPMMNTRSIKLLRAHAVKVTTGVLEKECIDINQPFMKYITRKIPYVTVKAAQSLDGRIATKTGDSKWITADAARKYGHEIRKFYDAILVGINTVLKDDPLLNQNKKDRRFFKVIIDPQLKVSPNARIFSQASWGKVIIACSDKASKAKIRILEKLGAKVLTFAPHHAIIPLKELLQQLAGLEISNVLVEGGGETIGRFFDEKLVDKVLFFIAPKIIGGKNAVNSVMAEGIRRINQAIDLKEVKFKKIGRDFLAEGYVYRYS